MYTHTLANPTRATLPIFLQVMCKKTLPDLTLPLVEMAEIDSPVTVVTVTESRMITQVSAVKKISHFGLYCLDIKTMVGFPQRGPTTWKLSKKCSLLGCHLPNCCGWKCG